MPRFRKKPVEIEAWQIPLNGDIPDAMINFLSSSSDITILSDGRLEILTLEGKMIAKPGDWIIRGIKGEYYPCKADIFEKTYEPID